MSILMLNATIIAQSLLKLRLNSQILIMRNDSSVLLKFKLVSDSEKHFELQSMSNKNIGNKNDDNNNDSINNNNNNADNRRNNENDDIRNNDNNNDNDDNNNNNVNYVNNYNDNDKK